MPINLPCAQCIGCRLDRSRKWAIRCVHEASLYPQNAFITLTYDNSHIPKFNTLKLSHFQKFLKKLRKKLSDPNHFKLMSITSPRTVRFFHCGEYGENLGRPHYHALIFNYDFPDKVLHHTNDNGDKVFDSAILKDLWGRGIVSTGAVTLKSAAYVARYITKKITGPTAESHYSTMEEENGEWFDRKPEYTTMSRRPGIGKQWYENFKSDLFPSDFVVISGKQHPVPTFYSSQFEKAHPQKFALIKAKRQNNAKKMVDDNTPARLKVKESIKLYQAAQLLRKLK